MTDQTLRDKIARALNIEGAFCGTCDREPGDSLYCKACARVLNGYADAVLAVLDLDKVRAEAQVEALREVADETERKRSEPGLVLLDVRYQCYYTGIRSGMESAMRLIRETADNIAREAGIETGEEAGA